jgi:hypothetical protein
VERFEKFATQEPEPRSREGLSCRMLETAGPESVWVEEMQAHAVKDRSLPIVRANARRRAA